MKRIFLGPALVLLFLVFTSPTFAHSGRTDSSGGHNCYTGSCAGTYHYHNSGYTPSYSNSNDINAEIEALENKIESLKTPTPTIKPVTPKPTVAPTATPTITPTPSPAEIPEVEGLTTETVPSSTPTPEPLTAGETVISLGVFGVFGLLGWKALRWLGRKASSEI